jgi:outer membrane protein OmpA-like peptidoglycan-associated protein
MKSFLQCTVALAAIGIAPALAEGWNGAYIGVNLGYNWGNANTSYTALPDEDSFTDLANQTQKLSPHGVMAGGQAGYNWQFGENARWLIGMQTDFDWANVSRTRVISPVIDAAGDSDGASSFLGTRERLGTFGTTRLRFGAALTDRFLVYATGGAAYGDVRYDGEVSYPDEDYYATRKRLKLGWTAGGGFDWMIAPRWFANLEYLYYDLGNETCVAAADPADDDFAVGFRWKTTGQIARIGINYMLQDDPPPPQSPESAAPPPPLPPPAKNFIVFFDFNKSNLMPDALTIVQEAVKTAKAGNMVRMTITGHTDTVGTHAFNQDLSERRAEAVKEEMVTEGINDSQISTLGKSFDDPLVPTGPGVREPQNRRAVIVLGNNAGM